MCICALYWWQRWKRTNEVSFLLLFASVSRLSVVWHIVTEQLKTCFIFLYSFIYIYMSVKCVCNLIIMYFDDGRKLLFFSKRWIMPVGKFSFSGLSNTCIYIYIYMYEIQNQLIMYVDTHQLFMISKTSPFLFTID